VLLQLSLQSTGPRTWDLSLYVDLWFVIVNMFECYSMSLLVEGCTSLLLGGVVGGHGPFSLSLVQDIIGLRVMGFLCRD
jgi:hypothetical protein